MRIKKIIVSALFASLICLATMIFKMPIPGGGYANLGDCLVISAGYFLPFPFGMLAAAAGSALADVIAGYAVYAPATLVIKGLMAFIVYLLHVNKSGKFKIILKIIASLCAEASMAALYFLYECAVFGKSAAALGVYGNIGQGAIGIISSLILISAVERSNYLKEFFGTEE